MEIKRRDGRQSFNHSCILIAYFQFKSEKKISKLSLKMWSIDPTDCNYFREVTIIYHVDI